MPIILGGGLGGLSAAHYLARNANKLKTPIALIESSNRLGGWIKSENHNDFVLETGPRTIRPTGIPGKNTLKLLEELKLENKIKPILSTDSAAKNRMIYVNNQLCLLPSDFSGAIKKLPPFSKPLISFIINDIFTGKSKAKLKDESIYSFANRRFGKEFADYLISSMICGICAGDAKEISVKFLMKDIFLKEQKYGGVVRGMLFSMLNKKKEKIDKSKLIERAEHEKWSIYSLEGGLELLPKTMVEQLKLKNIDIQTNALCKEIKFKENKVILNVNDKNTESDYLISSISSYRLSYLLKNQYPELAANLKAIPFVDVAVINFQYNTKDLLKHDGFGFLVPPNENLPILGIIFDSCCFKSNNNTVLTVMMGGKWFKHHFGPDPTEQELLEIARRNVKKILGIKISPTLSRVQILKKCIPQYIVGHSERVDEIENYIKKNNIPLALCGSSYYGVGVNDVILSSKNLVESKFDD